MITFRLARHDTHSVEVVEILDGDRLVGVLYPQADGVRLVSSYLEPDRVEFTSGIPRTLEIKLP